jgi:integrase
VTIGGEFNPALVVPYNSAEDETWRNTGRLLLRGESRTKALDQLRWHLGGSQGDMANLKGEDVDWQNQTVCFIRKKTSVPVIVHLGTEALNQFKDLSAETIVRRLKTLRNEHRGLCCWELSRFGKDIT